MKKDSAKIKQWDRLVDLVDLRAFILTACILCFCMAMWFMIGTSADICSGLNNEPQRSACYDQEKEKKILRGVKYKMRPSTDQAK
jgi:hypothetical protein